MPLDSFSPQDNPKLGSLAQNARSTQLKSAKTVLFVIGVLTIIANGFFAVLAESAVKNQFDKEIREGQAQGLEFDQAKVQELQDAAVLTTRIFNGAFILLGVVFVVFGFIVEIYPVPVTILALILYGAGNAVTAIIDPTMIAKGLIIKIFIIVALVKALQAAIAFQKEQDTLLTTTDNLALANEP